MSDQKNLIAAAGLSFLVIIAWTFFFAPPPDPDVAGPVATEGVVAPGEAPANATGDAAVSSTPTVDQSAAPGDAAPASESAAAAPARIKIETPSYSGTISLRGGRLDDLHLTDYRETLDPTSDTVVQLAPVGTTHPYYAVYGWLNAEGGTEKTPDPNTEWSVETGEVLTPETPITLIWDNGEGLIFRRNIAVDEKYMFTITQSVENTTGASVSLAPYGYIARRGEPETVNFFILHEGAVGVIDGELKEIDYGDMEDLPTSGPGVFQERVSATKDGFAGFTDKYWMTTIAPGPGVAFDAAFKLIKRASGPEYRTEALLPIRNVAAGSSSEASTYLFSGAKEYETIEAYQETLGIDRFDDSIDWGWFFFLTKPIFKLLLWVEGVIGNMGWSIIVLTLIIKAALFPLAYKSYVSMSKMKKLQPEMEKIKERVGDDRQKMQQEMMALYKKEKANPAAGCLPIILQIPIFFSLYKVLFVTIEMRHAPFIWWIHDLSAPDPTSILNLFGLLPWAAPDPNSLLAILSIGVFPILMGITMWMQQKLNPAPTDKMQAQIFAWMPWIFMFMLGRFASGLVIYWCANNTITFIQQYLIMRSQGVDVDFLGNVKKSLKRKPKEG
ncbi:membrane protein insertase YidC [Pikeienuella piscinae]|uniref:Membrane protein insertase YidC n=1 Tax=Pikeienuella piscinae TaxID=2748098 RepID=A0A7L5C2L6_9RHOB|nr:membrane protein insertase YidC [Pikeienuella piscinae]QIE57087.1 membrane protein insertase YidC [Pikeienuella piscinae]